MKKMKQIYIGLLLFMGLMTGCNGKKDSSEKDRMQIYQIDSVDIHSGVQRMQISRINQDITCRGNKYKLAIERASCDSLPVVKSDMGTFADNRITVTLTRENGKTLFSKIFTKMFFAPHLTSQFLSHSVLEGIVFDDLKTEANKEITLAASVSYPMTDLYIPFTIVISQDGRMTLSKDEDMGALPPEE